MRKTKPTSMKKKKTKATRKTKAANTDRINIEKPCNILKLPDHITQEIFGRLSLKALTQCKFVCKSWHRCLSNPDFTQFLVSRGPTCQFLKDMSPYMAENHVLADLRSAERPNIMVLKLLNSNGLFNIAGSSNGFVCSYVRSNHGVYFKISNPIIKRECITLPIFKDMRRNNNDKIRAYGFGFGFSSISHVYKVTVFRKTNPPCNNKSEFMVLTVGSGSWRSIGNISSIVVTIRGVFHNGFLHWICECKRSPKSRYIRAFDVESERFKSLPMPTCGETLPQGGSEKNRTLPQLGVINGSLSITYFELHKLQVWLRKEDGGKMSWTKELDVHDSCLGRYDLSPYYIEVLKLTKASSEAPMEVLMLVDFELSLYVPATGTRKRAEIDEIPDRASKAVKGVHIPSVLSPKDIIRNYISKAQMLC